MKFNIKKTIDLTYNFSLGFVSGGLTCGTVSAGTYLIDDLLVNLFIRPIASSRF
jgi:hypothetical protein